MSKVIKYEHHGTTVSVQEDLKGKRKENCLCTTCVHFHPEDSDLESNCIWAKLNFWMCCNTPIMVAPVYECSQHEENF